MIQKANPSDAERLTEIAFAGKRHWGYPESYIKTWESELTITKGYVQQNLVFKALDGEDIVGFYSLIHIVEEFQVGQILVQKGWWLDHLFILPEFHKRGIGKMLTLHALAELKKLGPQSCFVFVDPYAAGFYEKMGANFLYHSPSSIEGRMIPVYQLNVR